ncbi:hypothetical protein, partial [Comamonas jiangduensis]|uniref:hypothetical protein n=1 Tax=Comamonas jiangduensis TaxID=1194168 RepID=UPI0028A99AFA
SGLRRRLIVRLHKILHTLSPSLVGLGLYVFFFGQASYFGHSTDAFAAIAAGRLERVNSRYLPLRGH